MHVITSIHWFVFTDTFVMVCFNLRKAKVCILFKTDMYLMFDKVWNGEYNEYAVESRIIGEETLFN